jgi:DNA-binding SARP family transcriptional activator
MRPGTRILVLGPLAVERGGAVETVTGRRVQTLLGVLVLSVNHAVSADRLADLVWPEGVPPTGMNALQSHVSRLRSLLGEESLVAVNHSYTLIAECPDIDSCQFEKSVVQAAELAESDPQQARQEVLAALKLWRGNAYGELGDEVPFRVEALRLDELRRTAVEIEMACDVALGESVRAIARLRSALSEDPYREHLWHLLVRALTAEGRRVDALKAFEGYASILAELGLKPDDEAVALREAILAERA